MVLDPLELSKRPLVPRGQSEVLIEAELLGPRRQNMEKKVSHSKVSQVPLVE